MPRKNRVYFPGATYHLMARGVGGRDIFEDTGDYMAFIHLLQDVKKELPFRLYAYTLMSNHFHLLLQVIDATASKIMQQLMGYYAQHHFSRRNEWNGHLFQGRHKAILCMSDPYFLELIRYIHLNPVRAGMCKLPSDWFWSGHKEYLGEPGFGLIDKEKPLGMLSVDPANGPARYEKFVLDGLTMGHRKDFYPMDNVLDGFCPPWIDLGETGNGVGSDPSRGQTPFR